MSDLKAKLAKLASENPELRQYLVPILKEAMEFDSEEAKKKYLETHDVRPTTKLVVKDVKKSKDTSPKKEKYLFPSEKAFNDYDEYLEPSTNKKGLSKDKIKARFKKYWDVRKHSPSKFEDDLFGLVEDIGADNTHDVLTAMLDAVGRQKRDLSVVKAEEVIEKQLDHLESEYAKQLKK